MTAPLSIVIPTLNASAALGQAVACLYEGLEAGLISELIVVDGGSNDKVGALAKTLGAQFLTCRPGRGLQLATGASAANGRWLLFLHADTKLTPGWSVEARDHMMRHPKMAGYFRLRYRARGLMPLIVARWANLRSKMLDLPYGDQGLLISRPLYEEVGGYSNLPLMEDVAIAGELKGRLRKLDAVARTSAARYQRDGWLRCGWRNMALVRKFRSGVPAEELAKVYDESPAASTASP